MGQTQIDQETLSAYWAENKRLTAITLIVWALVSYGAVFFVESLNAIVIFGFPLGYYMAAQGSLIVFVILVFTYAGRMNAVDRRHNLQDDESGEER